MRKRAPNQRRQKKTEEGQKKDGKVLQRAKRNAPNKKEGGGGGGRKREKERERERERESLKSHRKPESGQNDGGWFNLLSQHIFKRKGQILQRGSVFH